MIADVVCERGVAAGDGATDHVQGHCHLQARMRVDGIAEDAQGAGAALAQEHQRQWNDKIWTVIG